MLKSLRIYDYDPLGLSFDFIDVWDEGLNKLGNVVVMSWDDFDDDDDDDDLDDEDDDDDDFGFDEDDDADDDDGDDDDIDIDDEDWITASNRWIVCDEDLYYETDENSKDEEEVIS